MPSQSAVMRAAPRTFRRLFRDANDNLYAPNFNRDGANRNLNLNRVAGDWDADNAFVAFRDSLVRIKIPCSMAWGLFLQ